LVRGEAVAGDVYPGVWGLFTGMREWLAHWDSYEVEPEDFVDLDDRVVVLTRERGVSKHAQVPVVQEGAVVYTFRGEKVLRIETYLERATALAAVGLSR
jgi:ketosteroid isomerase-like protein